MDLVGEVEAADGDGASLDLEAQDPMDHLGLAVVVDGALG